MIPVLFPPVLGAQDVPLAWDFPEVWRAGGLHAPEWAEFTWSDDFAFDGSGNLYVVDGKAQHIVKVGPDGSLVATIGRAGEGPGEFGGILDIIVWPEGSFVVNDDMRNGLQLFSADGRFQRVVRWRPVEGRLEFPSGSTWTIRPGPRRGILYAQGPDAGFGSVFGARAEADERMIEALDLAGGVVAGEVLLEVVASTPPRAREPRDRTWERGKHDELHRRAVLRARARVGRAARRRHRLCGLVDLHRPNRPGRRRAQHDDAPDRSAAGHARHGVHDA